MLPVYAEVQTTDLWILPVYGEIPAKDLLIRREFGEISIIQHLANGKEASIMNTEFINRVKKCDASKMESVAAEAIIEALKHLGDFCLEKDIWSKEEVSSTCFEIGEILYENGEMESLQNVYRTVLNEMKGVAARFLEHFWDGVGDGAWRG